MGGQTGSIQYIPLVSKFLQTDFVCTQDEISWDLSTHGAMLVGIVAGSDKTVASVATGHQEFHPVYVGPGNHCGHFTISFNSVLKI